MDDDGILNWSNVDQRFTYIVFPVVCIIVGCLVAAVLYTRFRRRQQRGILHGNPPSQQPMVDRSRHGRSRRRGAAGDGRRSMEGLNELGEAPPPYDGKKEDHMNTQSVHSEFRDLEAGQLPPDYPAEPPPAVFR